MSRHYERVWFLRYLEGDLLPVESQEFVKHVGQCSECESELNAFRRVENALVSGPLLASDENPHFRRVSEATLVVSEQVLRRIAPEALPSFTRLSKGMIESLKRKADGGTGGVKVDSAAAIAPLNAKGGIVADVVSAAYVLSQALPDLLVDDLARRAKQLATAGVAPRLIEQVRATILDFYGNQSGSNG